MIDRSTDDMNDYVMRSLNRSTVVLGASSPRVHPAWASGPEGEDQASIDQMNNTPRSISNTHRVAVRTPSSPAVTSPGS
jgi:hypothetical protein